MNRLYITLLLTNLLFFLGKGQHFQNVTNIQNINVVSNITDFNGGWGNGVSFYDFNNDGWDDLTIALENDTIAFYENNEGNFERLDPFILVSGRVKQVLWVDFDNDGHNDIFITQYGAPYKLFKNDGQYNFTDISVQAGLPQLNLNTWGAAFGDYDRDGYLDLYVAMYESGAQTPENPLRTNQLFRNNGDGTFTNTTQQAGVGNDLKLSFLGAWIDYNRDGWPDLYVINDRTPFDNSLYRNNGDGTFTDVAIATGADTPGQDPMTISVSDIDNDSDYDIFMTNSGGNTKFGKLLINNDNLSFTESANQYGVDINLNSWGALWLDYDNSSYRDLFISIDEQFFAQPQESNLFFVNNNGQNFSLSNNLIPSDDRAKGYAVAMGDINNDGYYDFINHNRNELPFLYQNSGGTNNYIKVTLEGTQSNKMAIGAEIQIYCQQNSYIHYVMNSENFLGQNSQHQIFGLKNCETIDSALVIYPSGIIDKYYNLTVNDHYFFTEAETYRLEISYNSSLKFCEGDSITLDAGDFDTYLWNNNHEDRYLNIFETDTIWVVAQKNGFSYFSDTLVIEVANFPIFEYEIEHPSCFGEEDGSIAIQILNNDRDFEIIWNSTQEHTLNLENLADESYSFQYIDEFNCSFKDTIDIINPNLINIQTLVLNETDTTLGSISLQINGGTSPYIIFINGDTTQNPIQQLEAGIYALEIFDLNACSSQLEINLLKDSIEQTPLSINLAQKSTLLKVYPNPLSNNETINIETDNIQEDLSITLMNVLGQKLWEIKHDANGENKYSLKLPSLNKGVYIIKVGYKNLQEDFKIYIY